MTSPNLPPGAMQTYSLIRPRTAEFWRKVTCAEAECERHHNGWRSALDVTTEDGARIAKWIIAHSGRHFIQEQAGPVVTFTFPAGQACFEEHRRPIEREPLYVVRPGDSRQWTGARRTHVRGEDWRDDMQERLLTVADAKQRG